MLDDVEQFRLLMSMYFGAVIADQLSYKQEEDMMIIKGKARGFTFYVTRYYGGKSKKLCIADAKTDAEVIVEIKSESMLGFLTALHTFVECMEDEV